ncbi:MAG: ROK family glucokinase [Lachnospiraceae bacterium]|nr:ROK family glucokinase [Lachnospiraceae bacterium]
MSKYLFGIDLGGTTAKIGLLSEEGRLFDKWEIPTRIENYGKHILPDLAAAVKKGIEENALTNDDILGIGLAVPGAVLNEKDVAVCVNLNGWGGCDVAEVFSNLTGLPVKVVNDANAAALGELWQGGGKGYKSMVMVTLGTGVGGGIIIDGKLLKGAHGAGGEIGHLKLYPDTEELDTCGCGKSGCAEQFTSATGIVRLAKEMGMTDADSKFGFLSSKDVFDLAIDGQEKALEVVHCFAKEMGRMLASVSAVVDPEVFVIGGGVAKAGEFLLELVQPEFVKYAFPACEETKFHLAELGNDAGFFGAAKLFVD